MKYDGTTVIDFYIALRKSCEKILKNLGIECKSIKDRLIFLRITVCQNLYYYLFGSYFAYLPKDSMRKFFFSFIPFSERFFRRIYYVIITFILCKMVNLFSSDGKSQVLKIHFYWLIQIFFFTYWYFLKV